MFSLALFGPFDPDPVERRRPRRRGDGRVDSRPSVPPTRRPALSRADLRDTGPRRTRRRGAGRRGVRRDVGRAPGRRRCPPGTRRRRLGGCGRRDADRARRARRPLRGVDPRPEAAGPPVLQPRAGARREDPLPAGRRPRAHDPQRRPRRERAPRRRGRALRVRRRPRGRRRRAVVHDGERRSGRGDGRGIVERQVGLRRRVRPRCRRRGDRSTPSPEMPGSARRRVLRRWRRSRETSSSTPSSAGARLNSVSGDLHVAARRGLALWIDAQSVSGSVTSDLDVGGDEGEAEGGAQVELRARSVSGDIRITRAAPTAG